MLKVVLINPPQFARYPQPPMGLALIAAVLERHGYPVRVIDANVLRLRPEQVPTVVGDADVIGITAMTPTIGSAVKVARYIKQAKPRSTIVLGGCHATLLPEETLASTPEVDILVVGEGEETIAKVLQALQNGQGLNGIPGLSYRIGSGLFHNPPAATNVDLDSLPFLAYHLLPLRRYRPHPPHGRSYPFAALITSRGCPYQCSYCSKPVFGSRFRAQSVARVIEEILYHKTRFGVKEIAFYDDVFTLDKKRAYAIAEEIMKAGIKIDWTCETRVNLVDKELLHHIKAAGCYAIAYGIESASPDILNQLRKNISLDEVREAVRATQEVGLQTIGYFMLGSPGESPETIESTIRFAKELRLDFAQFSITIPFPGTELYSRYLESGGTGIPWESFTYAAANARRIGPIVAQDMSGEELQRWVTRAYRQFYLRPSYLWQRIRKTTSVGDLKVNLKGISMLLDSIRTGQ